MTVDEKGPHAVTFTKPSDLEFRAERTFDHPIERVWAAYTDPALIPQWWGQGTTVDRLDLGTGGGWRFVSKSRHRSGERRQRRLPRGQPARPPRPDVRDGGAIRQALHPDDRVQPGRRRDAPRDHLPVRHDGGAGPRRRLWRPEGRDRRLGPPGRGAEAAHRRVTSPAAHNFRSHHERLFARCWTRHKKEVI